MPKDEVVLRVTIDEKLSDTVVRLLVARPEGRTATIMLGDACAWADEDSVYATPETLLKHLRIEGDSKLLADAVIQVTGAESKDPTAGQVWNGLAEGMVLVVGCFLPDPATPGAEPTAIKLSKKGDKRILRVDNLKATKDGAKAAYAEALTGQDVG
jgi:hypothetical protein